MPRFRLFGCLSRRICYLVYFRRLLMHARRPYFLLVVGMAFLLVIIASLQPGTGVEKVLANGWGNDLTAFNRVWLDSNTSRVDREWLLSREGTLTTLVTLNKTRITVVSEMETRLRDMQKRIKIMGFGIETPQGKTTTEKYQYRDLAAMQAERQDRIRHVCDVKQRQAKTRERKLGESLYHEGWYGNKFHYHVMEVYKPQNFFFCPVLKVGSTFFRRLFYALSHGMKISSPYVIPIRTALMIRPENLDDVYTDRHVPVRPVRPVRPPGGHPAPVALRQRRQRSLLASDVRGLTSERPQINVALAEKRVADFLQKAAKVMFTREPYSKLLSGYVDKLFAPNPYFWKTVGRFIIKEFRHNPTSVSLTCGHDVTFPEFIKYVIRNERSNDLHRDTHFVPSYDQCKPCDYHYDVIGKMETFSKDASLVVAQLGFNISQSTLKEWSRESEFDAIEDSITSPYRWRKDVTKCMTWELANKRIWRKLQIRGILDRNEPLPINYKQSSSSSAEFIQLVKSSWERFRTNGTKQRQKAEALSSAYSLVPKSNLELLREYFLLDFDLFDYDSRPAKIFEAKNTWDVFNITQ
ncbi:uncharacterized protein [Littorina saxatilis]|uniref:uncharacterized protein isoform X2 n=1 Tax=Littorina saxatilis TaxID=31220 RepID=UPI0038B6ACBD